MKYNAYTDPKFTRREVAQMLRISENTVGRRTREGRLGSRYDGYRHWYSQKDIDDYKTSWVSYRIEPALQKRRAS